MSRPSEYNPAICDKLIDIMSNGLSFPSACAELNISPSQAKMWQKSIPEFAQAREIGTWKHLAFYEDLLKSSAIGIIPEKLLEKGCRKLNTRSIQFALARVHPEYFGAERLKSRESDLDDKAGTIEKLEEELRGELGRLGLKQLDRGGAVQAPSKDKASKDIEGES